MATTQNIDKISILIDLEQSVKKAQTLESLRFIIVNQTRRLIDFDQGVYFSLKNKTSKPVAEAVSGIANLEQTSPFIQFVQRMAKAEMKKSNAYQMHLISGENLSSHDTEDWNSLSAKYILWIPLIAPQRGLTGILWLSRYEPYTEHELILLEHIALTYAHALQIFYKPQKFSFLTKKIKTLAAIFVLTIIFCIPVHLNSIGSVEIIPKDPHIVTSPLDGVIEKILVKSNQKILKGETVAVLDSSQLKNNVIIAQKALEVAQAQLKKAQRSAFSSEKSRQILEELKAMQDLKQAELEYAKSQLQKSMLTANKSGVAVVNSPNQWIGRPVQVGEKILLIADPSQLELEIMLPVKDSILISTGAKAVIFLDTSPLSPKQAEIIRAEYSPRLTQLNTLAYRITAEFTDKNYYPRIGLKGTAKIYGKKVSLFYYLFRKPITAIRQRLGL